MDRYRTGRSGPRIQNVVRTVRNRVDHSIPDSAQLADQAAEAMQLSAWEEDPVSDIDADQHIGIRGIEGPLRKRTATDAAAPEGLSTTQIHVFNSKNSRRTLQRLLRQWVDEGQISAVGKARSRRYRAIPPEPALEASPGTFPSAIALSPDRRDILAYVRQPLEARKPVGGRRAIWKATLTRASTLASCSSTAESPRARTPPRRR